MQTKLQAISTEITDHELIEGFKNSMDQNSLNRYASGFEKRYKSYVYHTVSDMTKNFTSAEEIAIDTTQETFIEAFKLLKNFSFKKDVPESDHVYILKGWLGRIAYNCFKKVYAKYIKPTYIENTSRNIDDVFCPLCSDYLLEEKKYYVCRNKHYKILKEKLISAQPLEDAQFIDDLFQSLYEKSDVEVPNECRVKLQVAMNTLSEKQKHILLVYANEGCLDSRQHLSDNSLKELCEIYDTTPDTIKHIKSRAFNKIKSICVP